MNFSSRFAAVLALACGIGGVACAEPEDDLGTDESVGASADELTRSSLRGAFKTVIIGRMFQHDDWTIEAAETYKPEQYKTQFERRVAYVCDTISALDPTYVSGLLRFDGEEKLGEAQVSTFKAVRECIRKNARGHAVRFDVVLNALHYSDPDVFPNDQKGGDALKKRLGEVKEALNPDFFFFDFYTNPYNDKKLKKWHEGAIDIGIRWIHANKRLVGGNVWGNSVPKGTDYAAVDDSGGLQRTAEQANAIARQDVPTLFHIQNDPHIPKSEGVKWMGRDLGYRKSVLADELPMEKKIDVSYMLPVFFPLKQVDREDGKGKRMVSYDARQDGDMMTTLKKAASR